MSSATPLDADAASSPEQLRPDNAAAIDFLEKWHPGGPWVLTAIAPDRKGIETQTFADDPAWGGLDAFLEKHNGFRNCYFSVNPTLRPLDKKAQREDIKELAWLHVDIDPRAGEDINEERARALALLTTNLPRGVPQPTCIVFSGGGYQGFWRLEDPFPIDGNLAAAEEAKRWNMQLELLFGADQCHNVDRIMRLPGTVNIPDKKKKEKGRTRVVAQLIDFNDVAHPRSAFTQAAHVALPGTSSPGPLEVRAPAQVERLQSVDELAQWGVTDRMQATIVQGEDVDYPKEGDNSRSAWLYHVVCDLVRHEVPDDVIFSVITDKNFQISASVLDKGSNIEKYALRQIKKAKEASIDPQLAEFNERFAIVSIGGKTRVVNEVEDPLMGRTRLSFKTKTDFLQLYANRKIETVEANGKPKIKPFAPWWFDNTTRRFEQVAFSPQRDVPGIYNLWKGFAYDARPGECSLYLKHLLDNICSGNAGHYNYLLGWMATCVQKPASQGHTAVVLRGTKGTGKGVAITTFGKLFGRHFLHIANASHLVGNFNAHLRDALVVFADEAFFAGDKRHESVLKMLITEQSLAIEQKGVDVEQAPNFTHLMMASNEEWVVPAGEVERRFFVLDVSESHRQDHAYFQAITDQLESGGYEALLHHLMNYDLSGFEVRRVPQTDALADQKALSLGPFESWWLTRLEEGEICGVGWPEQVHCKDFRDAYTEHAKNIQARPLTEAQFGKRLKKLCPAIHKARPGNSRGERRVTIYILPTLEAARAAWDTAQSPREWPSEETPQRDWPPF